MKLGKFLFRHRSYTPIPLILFLLVFASPNWILFFSGLFIILTGELIRFNGVAYAGRATRTTRKAGAGRLITDGPFAYVRNPLYIGNYLISLGMVVMSGAFFPWMILIHFVLFFFQYQNIVLYEEESLKKKFSDYQDYFSHVNRWLPRLTPFPGRNPISPDYTKALRSEKNTIQAFVSVTILILIRWHLL